MKPAAHCITLFTLLATTGCAVGPDFKRPDPPGSTSYSYAPLPEQTVAGQTPAEAAQRFAWGRDVHAQWWKAFASPALDALVEAALQANPDLQAAEAALREARWNAAAQRGMYWPSAELQLSPLREKPGEDDSVPYTLHAGQLNISYVPDLFGANRREVEALVAEMDMQRFEREAVYTTLVANVVNAAIEEASLRAQIAATRDLVELSAQLLKIARRQYELGDIGGAEVVAQESELAQAQAALPGLHKQLGEQRNLLAVLVGRFPSEELAQRFELDSLSLPDELPVSLPAHLVEQRPDIRAAEAQLQAASAMIGVAKAARLPNLTLTATGGRFGADMAQFKRSANGFWSLGADLLQPVFQGRALRNRHRAAQAAYDQAAALYRGTVLTAFQDVADTLQAIVSDAEIQQAAAVANEAAHKSLAMATRQRELGALGNADLILARQAYQETTLALIEARAARYSSTVALFQALGGGWWQRPEPPSTASLQE